MLLNGELFDLTLLNKYLFAKIFFYHILDYKIQIKLDELTKKDVKWKLQILDSKLKNNYDNIFTYNFDNHIFKDFSVFENLNSYANIKYLYIKESTSSLFYTSNLKFKLNLKTIKDLILYILNYINLNKYQIEKLLFIGSSFIDDNEKQNLNNILETNNYNKENYYTNDTIEKLYLLKSLINTPISKILE
jgi:hypothetical protein